MDFDLCADCFDSLSEALHPVGHKFYERVGRKKKVLDMAFIMTRSLVEDVLMRNASVRQAGLELSASSELRAPSGAAIPHEQQRTSTNAADLFRLAPFQKAKEAAIAFFLLLSFLLACMPDGSSPAVYFVATLCALSALWGGPLLSVCFVALVKIGLDQLNWRSLYDHILWELRPRGAIYVSRDQILYSKPEVDLETRTGGLVSDPLRSYVINVFFYRGQLVSADDATLFSAQFNNIACVKALIVQPPMDVDLHRLEPSDYVSLQVRPWVADLGDVLSPIASVFDDFEKMSSSLLGTFYFESSDMFAKSLLEDQPHVVKFFQRLAQFVPPLDPAAGADSAEDDIVNFLSIAGGSFSPELLRSVLFGGLSNLRQFVRLAFGITEKFAPSIPMSLNFTQSVVFHIQEPQPQGYVILEADRIVCTRSGREETLCSLIRERCPNMNVVQPDGDRPYARVRVSLADEAVVRAVIKALARERGKRSNVRVIERRFDSPRD
eukprot:TRINITY_DN20218_c0_g1_i1.p1 TRINITY_DN20218_c0_g1~~TRINITY_DN20218_c0_g1_i1.p1  ORF type:complete len:564 (+),score=41.52 TRINITY_DN20218_c0_g1_i1:213-1694(+)